MIRTPTIYQTETSNAPLLEFRHEQLTIRGYSRAAMQTCWAIPELKVMFDHGVHSWDLIGIPNLALTHAHPDHMGGLINYVAHRGMMRAEAKVFVPRAIEHSVRQILLHWGQATNASYDAEIIACTPGDELHLSGKHILKPLATTHTVPSQGYCVIEKRAKLKAEFQGKSGQELAALRRSGVEIEDVARVPLVAFSGDTTTDAIKHSPEFCQAKILILEASFITDEPGSAHARTFGHVHLDDLLELADQLENELIILGHFSVRYRREEILAILEQRLPRNLAQKTVAWI